MDIPAKLSGRIQVLNLKDILYITTFQKKIYFYTKDHIYQSITTITDYLDLTKPHGFEMVDRNNVVQLSKIDRYDPLQKIAFFEGKDRYCTVSGSHEKMIIKYLK